WKLYVRKAEEHDSTLLKKWNEGLDVFLLFTGLFSAVLSTFLIASWSSLQQNTTQASLDALGSLSQQLDALKRGQAADPAPSYLPEPFEVPAWAVAVNALWYTSLFITLFAAVLAMLVKDWLR
ncbi:hypothetical protein DACRYDRAFT_41010, partial [Dacryopinax primogenitus]